MFTFEAAGHSARDSGETLHNTDLWLAVGTHLIERSAQVLRVCGTTQGDTQNLIIVGV